MPMTISFNHSSTRAALVISETPGNIITADLVAQLRAALDDLIDERHLRLISIEGAGADFSFGASIPEHMPEQIARVLPEMHALIAALLSAPAPTAAIVRGRCLGGGFELALACDFIFAAADATFGLPEISLGVFPPAASVLLPARAGAARATSAVLAGDARPASEWAMHGVVELMAPVDRLPAAVDAWFDRTLARYSAESLRHAVRAVRAPVVEAVTRGLPAVERIYLDELMRTHDASEGIQAFLGKRAPRWRDE
jgi:cyclohexa-1,5-dienecarbonyl-CoA hydratase